MVINSGAITPISTILDKSLPGTSLVRNASWALSNLVRGRPSPDFNKIKRSITSLCKVLVENDHEDILTDVCWSLSYISDGGEKKVPILISTNILPRII